MISHLHLALNSTSQGVHHPVKGGHLGLGDAFSHTGDIGAISAYKRHKFRSCHFHAAFFLCEVRRHLNNTK